MMSKYLMHGTSYNHWEILAFTTLSDIFIIVNAVKRKVVCIKDNIKGGALTETTFKL